jgi:hypothetical protein
MAIENFDNRPWVPHTIPNQIRAELYRRRTERGFNYVNSPNPWSNDDWKNYRGPLSSWVRVTSNGTGITKNNAVALTPDEIQRQTKDGFVLYGGQGFYDAFGTFNTQNLTYQGNIIGYDAQGLPHNLNLVSNAQYSVTVSNNRTLPILIPPPGIVSIETSIQKERIRKATINWKCYSFAQLEYMTPYFLTPGISVIVEYGWNHFNIDSLLSLTKKDKLVELWKDGTSLYTSNILGSNGMYDVTFGIIANFEFSSQDGITYDCKTEVYSKHRNHTGAFMNEAPKSTTAGSEKLTRPSFYEFSNQRLKKISKCLEGDGKNFFDPLDDSEEKKSKETNYDSSLAKSFYKNPNTEKSQIEDRICIARSKIKNDPFVQKYGEPDKFDWDKESPDDVWVTMGFLIELLNLFITQDIQLLNKNNNAYKLYQINIEDVIIGGHPNLITTDPSVLLIPNAQAPKFNLGFYLWLDKSDSTGLINSNTKNNKFQSQTYPDPSGNMSYLKGFKHQTMTPYDKSLFITFKTGFLDKGPQSQGAYRDDIDSFINRFRYNSKNGQVTEGTYSFPQYKDINIGETKYESGRYGYLKDLYVNINFIMNTAKDSKTVSDFLHTLLEKISGAVGGYWDLDVVENDDTLKIIDKKYIPSKIFDDIFQFDISSDSVVKSISFSGTPTSAQANQVIAGSSNNKQTESGTAVSTELPDFYFGDRLNINKIVPDNKKSLINESSDVIKQLQKYGKTNNAYLVSLKQYSYSSSPSIGVSNGSTIGYGGTLSVASDINFYKVYNLCLPSVPLLLTILNDEDYINNINIYGGQQPNFTCELTLHGIAGLRTFQCFSIKNLPKPYSENDIIFQIVDVSHSLQNGDWTTTIKAGIRPIRGRKVNYFNGKEAFESKKQL